jgi:putative transposon-encoded protein
MEDRFKIHGREVLEGNVTKVGNGAHVLVPKDWLGADVKVVRISQPDPDEE